MPGRQNICGTTTSMPSAARCPTASDSRHRGRRGQRARAQVGGEPPATRRGRRRRGATSYRAESASAVRQARAYSRERSAGTRHRRPHQVQDRVGGRRQPRQSPPISTSLPMLKSILVQPAGGAGCPAAATASAGGAPPRTATGPPGRRSRPCPRRIVRSRADARPGEQPPHLVVDPVRRAGRRRSVVIDRAAVVEVGPRHPRVVVEHGDRRVGARVALDGVRRSRPRPR